MFGKCNATQRQLQLAVAVVVVVVFNVSAIFLLNFSFEQLLASSVWHVLGLPEILTVCNNVATPWGMLRQGEGAGWGTG